MKIQNISIPSRPESSLLPLCRSPTLAECPLSQFYCHRSVLSLASCVSSFLATVCLAPLCRDSPGCVAQ